MAQKDRKLHQSCLFYTNQNEDKIYLKKIPRFQKFRIAGYRVYRESDFGNVMVCDPGNDVNLRIGDIISVEMYDQKSLKKGYYRVNRRHFFTYTENGLIEGVNNEFFFKVLGTIRW